MAFGRFGSTTVLIIEDDDFARQVIGRLLDNLGVAEVIDVAIGAEAFEHLGDDELSIDLIICDIEMPANTAHGLLIAGASFGLGFAMVWHIWWLAVLSFLAIPAIVALRAMRVIEPRIVKAAQVEEADRRFREQVASFAPATRADEETERNRGVPDLSEFAG